MAPFSELLRRARSGDRDAAADLLERYRDAVEGAARRGLGMRLQARYDAADIAQSVFADALDELAAFEDRGEPAFRAWLAAKVHHKLASKGRRAVRSDGRPREERLATEAGIRHPSGEDAPSDAAAAHDDARRLTTLLGTLDPAQTEVIGLFLDEGLAWEQIAERTGAPSAAAARMRYVRALAALRERWTRA